MRRWSDSTPYDPDADNLLPRDLRSLAVLLGQAMLVIAFCYLVLIVAALVAS